MRTLELLAPAKDLTTARAAIDSGADAVYMGGPSLGARAGATNSMDDIREAARYAHLFGAKLYMTMNTIVYEHELSEARRLAEEATAAGVDALIVQDLAYTRMGLEGVELHASTQLYNASPQWVDFLAHSGFSRVVLERGLTREQMAQICHSAECEIEAFVHGAICVCGSGRCFMSRSLSHRSGNRGECSQPCRLSYDLADGNGKIIKRGLHLLSVKDLDLSDHIGEMIDMGVISFKIEGRLKDEAYVRNVTAHYNNLLNKAIAERKGYRRASRGRVVLDFEPSPSKTFTRNGGDYIFRGKRPALATFDTPKAMGEPVGRIGKVGKCWFTLEGGKNVKFHSGDGICLLMGGELVGTNINSCEAGRIVPNRMDGIAPGAMLYRNHDKEFHDRLQNTRTRRLLPLSLRLECSCERLLLSARDECGREICKSLEGEFDVAAKPEVALASMRSSLTKSGASLFEVTDVEIIPQGGTPFVPQGTLNALRREVLQEMTDLLMESMPPKNIVQEESDYPCPYRIVGSDMNVVNSLSRKFYADHGAERIEEGYDLHADLKGVDVMRTPYCLRRELGHCLKRGSKLPDPLYIIHGTERFKLRFDCKACMMYVQKEN